MRDIKCDTRESKISPNRVKSLYINVYILLYILYIIIYNFLGHFRYLKQSKVV